ncbi:hypothetical protein ACFP1I_03195 [Dyadobacter subterraneus]|uniref:Uncharacterized protein n=1 Tax=Dyadobacter subterraneus TaxID=2773304 RepID=A0ABR9W832_9BACT|nr:hypothetical protein [Dyadobacter subterraneus]MBE9460399.1 hypothetical protein [Dyadobacter subterraneus]
MQNTLSPPPAPPGRVVALHGNQGIPFYIFAIVFSSFCVITGLIWDICWHMSIGRDGLFSPPHLIIYLGAVVSGIFSGYEILRVTFWGSPIEKSKSVKVWGFFYSSLGQLFCVWGALAMLTSAPFDDWWHNTYGLDITILSPPHTILALGIISVQFGAMISVISLKNQNKPFFNDSLDKKKNINRILFWLFSLSAGFLLTMWYTLLSEEMGIRNTHKSDFYVVACIVFPFYLMALGKAVKNKWTITAVTAIYSLLMLLTLWIIPLFPAEPKLGPIVNHIDHYQGFKFPILLIVPAFLADILRNKFAYLNDWILSLILGTAFLLTFFAAQWYAGSFLVESPYARNWFFGSHYWYFGSNPNWEFRYKFADWALDTTSDLIKGLGIALVSSVISTRIGLKWGNWMNKIQR